MDFMASDNDRRMFGGIERAITPLSEFSQAFDVAADRVGNAVQYSQTSWLEPGDKQLRVSFVNDFYDEVQGDLNLVIDRVEVRGPSGATVLLYAGENLREVPGFTETQNPWGPSGDVHWGDFGPDGWLLWSNGFVAVPLNVDEPGNHTVIVTAWAYQAGPDPARMQVTVNVETPWSGTAGETAIREKLAELHALMLGEELPTDDPDIDAVYDLLVETWQGRNERWPGGGSVWYWPDDNCHMPGEFWELDQSTINAALSDPENMVGSWVSVLMYYLTHYDYLHE
jgi:hypothetical protein